MVNRTTFVSVSDGDQLSQGYFNGIQTVVGGIGTATATTIVPPIGSILAWHKSFTGVPGLPGAWKECLTGETLIMLEDGTQLPIKHIVDNKLKIKVLCYDINKRNIVAKNVTNWFKNKSTIHDFTRINTTIKGVTRQINITPNHEIFTNRGWIPSSLVTEDDKVFTIERKLDESQKQFILGSMLGDGCGHGYRYTTSHCPAQYDYIEYIDNLFGNFNNSIFLSANEYGKWHTINLEKVEAIEKELSKCLNNGKKYINMLWLNEITEEGLAYWYMDDGNLQSDTRSNWKAINLHTEGFTSIEKQVLCQWLKNKFNLDAIIYKRGNLRLNANESKKFFKLISKYILPCFRYKIPLGYDEYIEKDFVCVGYDIYEKENNDFIKPELLKGGSRHRYNWTNRYNIEVEDCNNYFANGILVHNCDGSVISDADSPMDGQTLPNLNGGARFLIGTATTSGTLAGSVTHSHSLVGANAIASGSNVPNTTDSVNHLPPYMSIFWIMRIK